MNIDWMRRIDYYVGIPLCFLGTILRFFMPRRSRPVKNVLLIELSEMGSAILADPAMRILQADLGAELYFVIFEKNAGSLRLLGTVAPERVFNIRASGLFSLVVDTFRFLAWARRNRIDTTIDLELFSRFTALLSGFCGASIRVGFHGFHNEGLYRGRLLTHKVLYNPHMHIAKNFVSLVRALESKQTQLPFSKIAISDDEIRLQRRETSEEEKATVRAAIGPHLPDGCPPEGPFALVNANAGDLLPQRRWEMERYAALVRRMLDAREDVTVLLTGSPSERDGIERLCKLVNDRRCANIAGALRLEQLPGLYEISGLMVTNDSGAAHFASVTPLPTFILFGPETPDLYGPLGDSTPITARLACSPCVTAANHRKTACKDNVCMQAITPEMVFERIRPVLERVTAGVAERA